MDISWYARRLAAMGPREIAQRLADRFQQETWRSRRFDSRSDGVPGERHFAGGLSRGRSEEAPVEACASLLRVADRLLDGEWPVFAVRRSDVTARVDWHRDARNDTQSPRDAYAFDIALSGARAGFDAKYVWELSRHHHTTLLAMAFWLTGDDRYARAAVTQIDSWIVANPFLRGIHWSSGIEIGLRLIAFAWTRRLLEAWPSAREHFENDPAFVDSVVRHQWWLAHRRSHGSSANNHLLCEMAGLYVSTCCMPWHVKSPAWRLRAARILEVEFPRQIFPNGYSRELASDYFGFVLEALLVCLVEGELSGSALGVTLWDCARRMLACLDDISDVSGHPPRQGDSDDATGLLLDAPGHDRWIDLAYLSQAWFGEETRAPRSLRAWLLAPLACPPAGRAPPEPPATFLDGAGLAILRARRGTPHEIYCVLDIGPLGFLSIAAHGHADALAVELRYGGVPVLVDPGTLAYRGAAREYFRATRAHNTIELGGADQSVSGGPFLWTRHAGTRLLGAMGFAADSPMGFASGEHDGYLRAGGRHKRNLALDRERGEIAIRDEVRVAKAALCRMFFHLHPGIGCELHGAAAELRCGESVIRMELPPALAWRAVRGCEVPMLGWYSPSYDMKSPATTLVGEVMLAGAAVLATVVKLP